MQHAETSRKKGAMGHGIRIIDGCAAFRADTSAVVRPDDCAQEQTEKEPVNRCGCNKRAAKFLRYFALNSFQMILTVVTLKILSTPHFFRNYDDRINDGVVT